MTSYTIHLHDRPFGLIRDNKKTIEARLFDDKRKQIKLNDLITFQNRKDESSVRTKVIALHLYPSFAAMFASLGPKDFGGESVETLVREIMEYYLELDEHDGGVIGIEFVQV